MIDTDFPGKVLFRIYSGMEIRQDVGHKELTLSVPN